MTMILANLLLGLCISWLAVCRATHMSPATRGDVRWSVAAMGASSFALAIAPLVWGMHVHPALLAFEAAQIAVLVAMSRLWRGGTPEQLQR